MILSKFLKGSFLVASLALLSCGGSGGGGGSDDDGGTPPEEILPPEAAVLTSPAKDEECNQGNVVSDTKSRVTFDWNAAANTNSYTHVLKNLETDVETEQTTSSTSISLTIDRGVAYSWKIISKSNKTTTTATSEIWKFYNAGEGVENYAPFPAELVAPAMGSEVASPVTLSWTGSDVDNDIASYEVYLDTNETPTTVQETTTNTTIENIALSADTVYYWRVKTTDESGSSSLSPVFEFRTE
ncbi:fibronectin type III domain-containing protein [Seonamhaeicola marinus]|uniref:Fibronectin type-III domain-containing protein n=1 Tax=Seonamhaeicola marinus TaxID=1912246 RepID=A0A5D0H3Z7_9FLAO|nr:hypothetical protein [Seonamhaeicola marinus]TYA65945.1 hypothetical protein FUA24_23980 [Seonamhaeicola marinus]